MRELAVGAEDLDAGAGWASSAEEVVPACPLPLVAPPLVEPRLVPRGVSVEALEVVDLFPIVLPLFINYYIISQHFYLQ